MQQGMPRNKLQSLYDVYAELNALKPDDTEKKARLDAQLFSSLEKLILWANANEVNLPDFPMYKIANSNYDLGELGALIDIAEIEVRKYILR